MDLEFINRIFKNTELKRNGIFSTIGFLNIRDKKDMLVFIKDEKYLTDLFCHFNVSAVITEEKFAKKILENTECGIMVTENPEKLFYLVHNYLYKNTDLYNNKKIETIIGKNAEISSKAIIADKNVSIGDNVIIEPGVTIMEGVQIGDNCIIGANTTLGTRGFQYYRFDDEAIYIEHIGGVIIQNNVEILSNSCVASGLIAPTYLCDHVKIDNLVHIGHSAYLDKRVLVTAGVIVGGSSYIGKRVWLGINSVICASIHIGDDSFICMGAVVTKDVGSNQKVAGNFAIDHKKQIEFIKNIC